MAEEGRDGLGTERRQPCRAGHAHCCDCCRDREMEGDERVKEEERRPCESQMVEVAGQGEASPGIRSSRRVLNAADKESQRGVDCGEEHSSRMTPPPLDQLAPKLLSMASFFTTTSNAICLRQYPQASALYQNVRPRFLVRQAVRDPQGHQGRLSCDPRLCTFAGLLQPFDGMTAR